MNGLSIGCWRVPVTASAGRSTGWIWRTMPIPTASSYDADRPDAWRYRDWVVRALNADLPYDRFVALQVAGDELRPGDHEALIATGFGRCGPREVVSGNVIAEVKRQNELTEITGTVGSVFLGLTIGCARCHDHKFDAIPTTDYYRLQSFFAASKLVDLPIASKSEIGGIRSRQEGRGAEGRAPSARLAELEAPYRKRLSEQKHMMLTAEERAVIAIPEARRTAEQKRLVQGLESSLRVTWEEVAAAVATNRADHEKREALKREIAEIERSLPRPPAHAMALVDQDKKAPDTFVLRRGDYRNKGPKVAPRPLGVVLASQKRERFQPDGVVAQQPRPRPRAAGPPWPGG